MDRLRKIALVFAAAGILGATASLAGDRRDHDGTHHHRFDRYHLRGVSGGGTPVYVPGIGTYAGDMSVSYIRGTGLFLTFDPGVLPAKGKAVIIAPKAKIIDVTDRTARNGCSMEHGVCVIRAQ